MPKSRKKTTAPKSEESVTPAGLDIQRIKNFRPTRTQLVLLTLVGVGIIAWLNKGWFVAATVNGQPITAFKVNQKLNAAYKSEVLNQMINETLVEQEAAKKGVIVSPEELNQKIDQTVNEYGGKEVFESLLAQQGLNYPDFVAQTRLQLLVEKMFQNEIQPSEEEIVAFMQENRDNPEATDEAKFRATVIDQLKQSKLSEVFSEKFPELKKAANIQIF